MSPNPNKGRWFVEIIESEAGWGSRIDETIYFDDEQMAKDHVKEYNDKYNPKLGSRERVPEWYMVAQGPYQVK